MSTTRDFFITEEEEEVPEHEKAANIINLLSKQLFRSRLYFQWYMFQRLPVYYVYDSNEMAWTDGYGIYVTKKFIESSSAKQLFVLRHELYHIAFHHPEQLYAKAKKAKTIAEKNIIEILYNVIGDAVVNGIIEKENKKLGLSLPPEEKDYIKPDKISEIVEGDIAKLGFVNGFEKLMYLYKKGIVKVTLIGYKKGNPNGVVLDVSKKYISEYLEEYPVIEAVFENKRTGGSYRTILRLDMHGTPSLFGKGCKEHSGKHRQGKEPRIEQIKKPIGGKKPKSREDIERIIKDALDFEKLKRSLEKDAGAGIAGTEDYLLREVGSKRPEWEAALSSTLTNFLSKYVLVSWHFVNRNAPFQKPGIRYLTYPDMHILLDVSGSMLDGTLEKALKRVIYILEKYPVKVKLYQWSSVASLPQDVDRRFAINLKKYKKLRIETGGTEIEPALDMVLKHLTKKDAVIILTDGYIFDIDRESVKKKFKILANKAGVVIFASLGYIPESLPAKVKKIRLED